MSRAASNKALFLKILDLKKICKCYPKRKVGVSVQQIYIQIAKYSGNPKRINELLLLSRAVSNYDIKDYEEEPKYVIMEAGEVERCFNKSYKNLPKNSFIWVE
jgi:hypothetical protein